MATRPYNWQSPASPAASSGSSQSQSQSGGASPYGVVDPFYGSYPNAPHLRPIELPETGSPMPVYASPGPGSSRSRTMSLPPQVTGLGIYTYGIPSPPTSPHSTSTSSSSARTSATGSGPTVHPLLRGYTNSLSAPLAYNVLRAPSAHGLRTAEGVRINPNDLNFPATHPAYPALRVSVLLFPGGGHGGRRFMWDVTLTPSRRSSAPPTSTVPLTLGDALASLHLSLLAPISESEVRQVGQVATAPQDLQSARTMCAARCAAYPNSPSVLVRADFLYGCTEFAGFVRNADGSFAVRLTVPAPPRT